MATSPSPPVSSLQIKKSQLSRSPDLIQLITNSQPPPLLFLHTLTASPVDFFLEFQPDSKVMVKCDDGSYAEGEQNGGIKNTGASANLNTLWEC